LIPDYLNPMPSHLLTTTIADLLHTPALSSPTIQSPPQTLPQGHHLVYFPIQTPPSKLAADGADQDHSPGSEFPRRMWAGGEVIFHPGWRQRLVMDGRPWTCKEEIGDVRVKGDIGEEKVFVDVWRRYGAGEEWNVEERRTLVFMRAGAPTTAPRRAIKCEFRGFVPEEYGWLMV
jgi:hydroxyacyl-ACP dehydratase HTD2-like protein with hotdog domain